MSSKLSLVLLLVIILVHSFILIKLIFYPYPELFVYPYLTNHGLKPYSQILDQHFPGLMFLPINLNSLGMEDEIIARGWSIGIVVLTQILLFFIASSIFKSQQKTLLVNLLYLIWQPFFEGWVLWIDSFLPIILLPAFYFLYKQRIFWAGFFLGLGVVFKQVLLPLSFLVLIYIFWQSRSLKTTASFLMGLMWPIGFIIFYLASIGVLEDFWYWTVVFNLTVYAQFGRGVGPTLAHFSRVVLVFGSAFLIFRKIKTKEAQILTIFLFGTLLGLSTRFDFVHFQPALPFAILATIFAIGRIRLIGRIGLIGGIIYILITGWWLIIFYKGHLGQKVYFFDTPTKEAANKIRQYSRPSDKIFVFGAAPHLYQMADRLPAGNIFVFQFPWFMKVAEDRVLEGFRRDRPTIIVADRTLEIEGQKITDYAKKLDNYIQENYQSIDKVGTTDILRPRKL